MTGISVRQVPKTIKALEKMGYVKRLKSKTRRANEYRVTPMHDVRISEEMMSTACMPPCTTCTSNHAPRAHEEETRKKTHSPEGDADSKGPKKANNAGHRLEEQVARRIVALYERKVQSAHPGAAPATTEVATILANYSAVNEGVLLEAVEAYAKYCNDLNRDSKHRMGVLRFFRDGIWREYADCSAGAGHEEQGSDFDDRFKRQRAEAVENANRRASPAAREKLKNG